MNRALLIFIMIVILSLSGYKLHANSFSPWKTVCFSSIQKVIIENLSDKDKFNQLILKNPEYVKRNIFMYAISKATDETVYGGKDPYQINITFFTYDKDKEITIKEVKILNDDLNLPIDKTKTVMKTEQKTLFKGKNFEQYTSEYSKVTYIIPYKFNLQGYKKDLKIKILLTIDEESFEQDFILKRYEKKGLFKSRY